MIEKKWLGATKEDLLLEWGPPTKTAFDDHGNEILTYESYETIDPTMKQDMSTLEITFTPYKIITMINEFYIDEDGIIYSYDWDRIETKHEIKMKI